MSPVTKPKKRPIPRPLYDTDFYDTKFLDNFLESLKKTGLNTDGIAKEDLLKEIGKYFFR